MSAGHELSAEDGGFHPGYYERIAAVEGSHWWHVGMRSLTEVLLGDRLARPGQSFLDAGCGTGGVLRWIEARGAFARLAGTDFSERAITLARQLSPGMELQVAPLDRLPFDDASFDVVTVNDVLQHVVETDVLSSLRECARVLRPDGMLLIRTNGARRARRERTDWRVYDRRTLRLELVRAGLDVERVTYACLVPSLWATVRGQVAHAPEASSDPRDGIPDPVSPAINRVGRWLVAAERRWLASGMRSIPFGHTLFAVARRADVTI